MTITQAKRQILQAAISGDPVAMSVVAVAAELPEADTQWVFEEYGDDPATLEYILRAMAKDD
jgi:hypothetical protein